MLKFFFSWCGPFLKSLLNLLQYCFCSLFWFFGHETCSSPNRDQTHTPCIGWWSLNHGTTSEVPHLAFWYLEREFPSCTCQWCAFSHQWVCLSCPLSLRDLSIIPWGDDLCKHFSAGNLYIAYGSCNINQCFSDFKVAFKSPRILLKCRIWDSAFITSS